MELHLQAEELRESRLELELALRQYTERHDLQPVGCITLDPALRIREVNQVGAAMLDLSQDAACGLALDTFLAPASLRRMQALAASVVAGEPAVSALLGWRNPGGPRTPIARAPGGRPVGPGFLLVLTAVPAADASVGAPVGASVGQPPGQQAGVFVANHLVALAGARFSALRSSTSIWPRE